MDTSALRALLERQPFCPFTMRMNDGREYQVKHPEWVHVTTGNVDFVSSSDGSTTYLEPVLIASVHIEAQQTSD